MNIAQPNISNNIQIFSVAELESLINIKEKTLNINMIKEGCKLTNVSYKGGGRIFVHARPSEAEERELLTRNINESIHDNNKYIVVYVKDARNINIEYSYYSIIILKTSDIYDLKKVFKIQGLKVFI